MTNILKTTQQIVGVAVIIIGIALVYCIGHAVGNASGLARGIVKGNEQYHREMLQELEAKGGAPALLYPPDAMFEYPED